MIDADAIPPPYAATALALSAVEWNALGLDPDNSSPDPTKEPQAHFDSLVKRVTSLLVVRIVAVLAANNNSNNSAFGDDMSTSGICRTVLVHEKPWQAYAPGVTVELLQQTTSFCRTILQGYNDTPYHCAEHATHVVLSVNKMCDLLLQTDPRRVKTYGIRSDPISVLALLFAALVHDVEHKGVPNRQLVLEHDPLATMYNDQSVAEHRSLFVAFDTLLKPEYSYLRRTVFSIPPGEMDSESYWRFRKLVINLVLNTDIASPERTQLGKSKWKEAFGDTFESMERKLKLHLSSGSDQAVDDDDVSLSDSESSHNGMLSVARSVSMRSEEAGDQDVSMSVGAADGKDSCIIGMPPHKLLNLSLQGAQDLGYKTQTIGPKEMLRDDQSTDTGKSATSSQRRPKYRRAHAHSMPLGRRGSAIQLLQSDQHCAAKFQRRMSSYSGLANKQAAAAGSHGNNGNSPVVQPAMFRKRLGIRRSMDLSGEALEFYHSSTVTTESTGPDDEPDELKATVVMETIMTAADVAHNLQGWEQMVKWSGKLYMELRKAYVQGRGGDPKERWFNNQIGFLESYLLPLARRLEDTGVFGMSQGQMFADIIEDNRDTWLEKGMDVADDIIAQGEEVYPL